MVDIDPSSAMWGYGFGRIVAKREAEERAPRLREKDVEPAVLLEKFEIEGLQVVATVRNVDDSPARVFNVFLYELLRTPIIVERKGLLRKKTTVKVAEIVSKAIRPEIFTILPGQTFTFTIDLIKALDAHQKYVLELHMGERKFSPEPYVMMVTKLGWAYLLEFNGEKVEEISTMNLEQAGIFWGKLIAQAQGKKSWENIYTSASLY